MDNFPILHLPLVTVSNPANMKVLTSARISSSVKLWPLSRWNKDTGHLSEDEGLWISWIRYSSHSPEPRGFLVCISFFLDSKMLSSLICLGLIIRYGSQFALLFRGKWWVGLKLIFLVLKKYRDGQARFETDFYVKVGHTNSSTTSEHLQKVFKCVSSLRSCVVTWRLAIAFNFHKMLFQIAYHLAYK